MPILKLPERTRKRGRGDEAGIMYANLCEMRGFASYFCWLSRYGLDVATEGFPP